MDMQVGVEEIRQERKVNKGWSNLVPPKKGEVRNPRGRPKKDYDLAALAQSHAELAVKTLAQCLTDAEASWPAKVSAASELLDRGFGKAPQSLDVEHKVTLSDEFEAFVRRLNGQHPAPPMIDATPVEAAE
jgi:hypothetical protein